MVGGHTPLPVGRPSHGHHRFVAHDAVSRLDSIAGGIDVRIGCSLEFIDHNVSARAQIQTGGASQFGIGFYANGQHDQISLQYFS